MIIYLIMFGALALLFRRFVQGPMCTLARDLTDQVVIVTGCNTGIGADTVRRLAELGATVILACRSKERTEGILKELTSKYGEIRIRFIPLDLSDLESVQSFVKTFKAQFKRLDILLNNAGVMALPKRQETKQGLEVQFGTNHIGHFALTKGLLGLLESTPNSRVINVSSTAHLWMPFFPGSGTMHFDDLQQKQNYRPWASYSQSKLSNILFTKELNRYFESKGIKSKAVALHPGAVATELQRHQAFLQLAVFKNFFFKDQLHGAQTSLQCALLDFDKLEGGAYYSDCAVASSSSQSKNVEDAKRLWKISEEILQQNKVSFD